MTGYAHIANYFIPNAKNTKHLVVLINYSLNKLILNWGQA